MLLKSGTTKCDLDFYGISILIQQTMLYVHNWKILQ